MTLGKLPTSARISSSVVGGAGGGLMVVSLSVAPPSSGWAG